MSSIIKTLKNRRIAARNDRALELIIAGVGSPAMRDELIIISQRQSGLHR